MMKKRQIIAIGGAAFARPGQEPLFESYILKQTGKKRPKIAFLGTATGDNFHYIANFYATFLRLECRPSHIPLFERTPDLRKTILGQDAVFVGGGNTKSMLAVWREWGIDTILREAWERGIVLAGVSAGAICWFEEGSTDSWDDDLHVMPCLAFLPGSCCPHYSGEKERRPWYRKMVKSGKIKPGMAIDDGAGAHFIETTLSAIVAKKRGDHGYRLAATGKESQLPTKIL